MNRKYQIAGHLFEVSGEKLCESVARIEGFRPFEVAEGEPVFGFQEGKVTDVPEMEKVEYTLEYEGVKGTFRGSLHTSAISIKQLQGGDRSECSLRIFLEETIRKTHKSTIFTH